MNTTQREERKQLNEHCLYCRTNRTGIYKGVILNESATGMLLEMEDFPEVGESVCVLSTTFGEEESLLPHTERELMSHPMSRYGEVVRLESLRRVGIRFEVNAEQGEFRRWYRGATTAQMLVFRRIGVLTILGEVTLEVGTLVTSQVNRIMGRIEELLFALHETTGIAPTAMTLMRGAVRKCSEAGMRVTVIYGDADSKSAQLCQGFSAEEVERAGIKELYGLASTFPGSVLQEEKPADREEKEEKPATLSFVIVSRRVVNQAQLSRPMERKEAPIIRVATIQEALMRIERDLPTHVVLDMELEEMDQLLLLNRLKHAKLARTPRLIIVGPRYIEGLVRAAIVFPVQQYISRPYNDREYQAAIERLFLKS